MIVPDAIAEFERQKRAEGLTAITLHGYRKRLEAMSTFLRRRGVRRVADVVPLDLDLWFLDQARRGLTKKTRLGVASTVREFFRVMQERGLVLVNPARDIPIPDDGDEDLPQPPLDEADVANLLASLPRANVVDLRNRAHIELLYGCALRLRESIMLDVPDIDFAGKGGRDRLVPLMKGTAGAVRDYLAVRRSLLRGPDRGALFLSRRSDRICDKLICAVLYDMNRHRDPSLPRLHPHLFRHSIAVHLLRGGADVRHVQAFLGHASLETTKIYLRMVPGRLREDYDKAMPQIAVALAPASPAPPP